jgi:hypothetical protein
VVPIGLGVIAVLLLGNLRGVRQAAALFAAPTYAFIAAVAALVVVGSWMPRAGVFTRRRIRRCKRRREWACCSCSARSRPARRR